MSHEGGPTDDPVRLYDEQIKKFERWRNRKDELKNRSLGKTDATENVIEKRFEEAIETSQNHDDLVDSTITAFGPRSEIYSDTGWKLLGVEPLYEVDPAIRNPDILIGNDESDILVMVECKTGLSGTQGVLNQIREQAEILLDRDDYVAQKTGCEFTRIERVLCVPGKKADTAIRAIEQEEEEQNPDHPIFLWKLFRFGDETLQLHTNFTTRTETESTHKSELSRKLRQGDGVQLATAPALTPEFFPESNPYIIMGTVFSEILMARERMEGSIRKFTRDEVYDYINSQRTVPHYDIETVAEMICTNLLAKMEGYGLIEQTAPEGGMAADVVTYAYCDPPITGKSPGRILSNLRDQYKDEWVERKAEREAKEQVVEEFKESQSSLGDF